jgi:hypothetical protein
MGTAQHTTLGVERPLVPITKELLAVVVVVVGYKIVEDVLGGSDLASKQKQLRGGIQVVAEVDGWILVVVVQD